MAVIVHYHKLGDLERQHFVLKLFWRPVLWDQDVSMAMSQKDQAGGSRFLGLLVFIGLELLLQFLPPSSHGLSSLSHLLTLTMVWGSI